MDRATNVIKERDRQREKERDTRMVRETEKKRERERERVKFILPKIKFHIMAVRLAYPGRIIFLRLQIL